MLLCSGSLHPGSAAILAAFGAGETPALLGQTRQESLSRYLVLDTARISQRFYFCVAQLALEAQRELLGMEYVLELYGMVGIQASRVRRAPGTVFSGGKEINDLHRPGT
jgi:hypothetical protein